MPDLLQKHDVFQSMVLSAGLMSPLDPVERPLNTYGPCWCGSGKKWKFCHKDRDKKDPITFGQAQAQQMKFYQAGPCQHPSASAESCSTPLSIQSHTIQRRGGLAAIAENGHVYSTKKAFQEIEKRQGQVDMLKIGVAKASTFPGFCSRHDTELFLPVEQADSVLDAWNGFLLSFRAVTYELAAKDAQLRSHIASRDNIDNGKPFELQAVLQNFLHLHQYGIQRGLEDVSNLKAMYDSAFLTQDLNGFSFYGIKFDRVLPFAAAGAFMPEFDFSGTQLQRLGTSQVANQIALNITQLGGTTCAGFGWFGGPNCAAAQLVQSLKALPDAEKSNAVLVLSMEHLENFFCKPSWWEGLSPQVSASLHEKIAGGLPTRSSTALIEPGMRAVSGEVESVFET
ncbi:hypothetical protein J9978_22220 [Chromobacterium violaceum]|uniref:SEC-C domain-containing protein n=1 Tax=Chromobacterium violaceum TaxID=536 RepID=UPI001B3303BC|nr:SEC-C domain-containing protein [Chromobacterium violaceum]MBP4052188.1 hypothetical protein [Chromobacterium violaceum]